MTHIDSSLAGALNSAGRTATYVDNNGNRFVYNTDTMVVESVNGSSDFIATDPSVLPDRFESGNAALLPT